MAWYRTNNASNMEFINEAGAVIATAGTAPSLTITVTNSAGTKTLSSPGGNAVYATAAAANAQLLKIIDMSERYVIVDGSTL